MKKTLFLLSVLSMIFIACNNDKGNDDGPVNKKKLSRDKDENKDEFPNNRDYGMDRDYEDEGSSSSKGSIVGKWDVIEMDMEDMDEEEREDAERNASIEFRKDGTYKSMDSDGTDEGEYTYSKGRLTLSDGGNDIDFDISWKGSDMIMKSEGGTAMLRKK